MRVAFRIATGAVWIVAFFGGLSAIAAPNDGFVLTQWGRWTQAEAVDALNRAVSVGARHVTILVNLCQTNRSATEMRWCEDDDPGVRFRDSYQGQRLAALLPEIRVRQLGFNLIPMVQSQGLANRQWTWPSDRGLWFQHYGDRMEELAAFARDNGTTDFIVGSELTLLFELADGWRQVIRRIRAIYSGPITISAVIEQYPIIAFWDDLDSIGISAYFPLAPGRWAAAPLMLEASWYAIKAQLLAFSLLHGGKPITFVEIGYPNTSVAATMPWDYDWAGRSLDMGVAAKCWDAFRKVWSGDSHLRAFQIWGIGTAADDASEPKSYSPIGKPSEAVVRQLFSERSALP